MSTDTTQPIQIRAEITSAEWKRLKQIALERDTTTQQLVGAALRATYNLSEETSK